ncbi:valine--tRNA ligase [Selenomonas sp. oral taxon 892 str. F0426]|uniref:valine--tRNA ligase n=1 Tax=Selenomonas sp. oral taxon 892 TaxID=1321785 RepID=UPI0003ACED73|nr:valine--tRNA ligase [Selenomonas sp. oral taxon 892]ERJ90406.1 valine--tRNA ligase [Selenomonas sp. oral taxon 892 str. F0426]
MSQESGANIPKTYDPASFERKWYAYWEENKLFHDEADESRTPYSVVIPPPNVTGQLHMGHALDNTLQDILVRYQRMRGKNVVWVPGCDHAGIATQAKVEESLRAEGTNRFELGREKFLARVWDWKQQYGDRIMYQLRTLGASCDWERERFTMDEGCSRAVREVFVSLYEQGLIYQGTRITNWCPHCTTAISDIEVDHETEEGNLWHLRYPIEGTDDYVEIATTRPETMFGDTGVAVHPDDERYKDLVGKTLILPVVKRRIPLFADAYVDPAFGTGAVKVTPAHDPNDFEMGQRHNLEQVVVINADGTMGEGAGKYAGLDRYACRKALVKELEEIGALVRTEKHEHAVGHCSRCKTTIEPLVSKQWFVRMEDLAKPATQAVKDGRIRFVPERFTKIYENWLDSIRDWCISRQLWWGHRIPAWHCADCGETSVSREDITVCMHCGSRHIHQDEDVLDTWFSSALWPFETMGWPEQTVDLRHFYPTSTLVTGYDIIFFWVARMVMMGLRFGGDVPFRDVFIHGLVRDSEGRKMSKSLGNGIDPVEVIEKYGADTLRFMLITGNTPGNDMRFYWERVEAARNFANKIWNASRYMLMNLEGSDDSFVPEESDYTLADRWILTRSAETVRAVTANLENYELGEAGRAIYEFLWSEFCDWYIELTKARLYDTENVRAKNTALYVLRTVLERTMRLLHPFMPFLTEEIWQKLPHAGESIMRAPWPEVDEHDIDTKAETAMTAIMEVIKVTRNLRAELGTPPGKKSALILRVRDTALADTFAAYEGYFHALASASEVSFLTADAPDPENVVTGALAGAAVYLPLAGLIDVEKETARLTKERDNLDKEIKRLTGKLSNEGFTSKAPAAVVEAEREKLAGYEEKAALIRTRLSDLAKL